MRKILTVLSALALTLTLHAASVNWTVDKLGWTTKENGKALDGETLKINDNLSLTFSNGTGTSPVIYRLTTGDKASYIGFYSGNVMTVTANNATINSITFVVDEDASDAQTTQTTAGWSVKIDGSTYKIDSPTWTGKAESVVVTGNSKTVLLGLNIEYTVTEETPAPEPGEETTLTWSATSLSELTSDDVLDGMSFDINDVLSFTLASNRVTETDKDVIFKKTSAATTINLYSKNSITLAAAEGTTIKSIKFVVNTSEGTSNTPGWNILDEAKNSYTAENDTWTGEVSAITFTGKSAAQIKGLEIVYVTADNGDGDDDDNTEYQKATLFFTEDLEGSGAAVQNVTLSDNGVSVAITGTTSAVIDSEVTGYFGAPDDYQTILYRYRPGGSSTSGVKSNSKGVFTFPCDGTLVIYASNNQTSDRNLQVIQNDITIFDYLFKADDYKNPTLANTSIKVYPIQSVKVEEGTAYLLWPSGQVMLYGFEFIPATKEETVEGDYMYLHYTNENGDYSRTFKGVYDWNSYLWKNSDGQYVLPYIKFDETTYFVISAYEVPGIQAQAEADVNIDANGTVMMAPAKNWNNFTGKVFGQTSDGTVVEYDPNEEYGQEIKPFSQDANEEAQQIIFTPATDDTPAEIAYKDSKDGGIPTGVETITVEKPVDNVIYNVYGQRVDENYRGIVIKNGKKYIIR